MRIFLSNCNWRPVGIMLIVVVIVLLDCSRRYQPAIDQAAIEASRILVLEELAERKAKEIALRKAELSNHLEALTEAYTLLEQNKRVLSRDRDDWYSWEANAHHCGRIMISCQQLDQEILWLQRKVDDFRAEKKEVAKLIRGTREGILCTIEEFLTDHQGWSEAMLIRGQSRRLTSFLY